MCVLNGASVALKMNSLLTATSATVLECLVCTCLVDGVILVVDANSFKFGHKYYLLSAQMCAISLTSPSNKAHNKAHKGYISVVGLI